MDVERFIMAPLLYVCVAVATALTFWVAWIVVAGSISEKFEIRRSDWQCTESHKGMILVGKVWRPALICDNYRRNGR